LVPALRSDDVRTPRVEVCRRCADPLCIGLVLFVSSVLTMTCGGGAPPSQQAGAVRPAVPVELLTLALEPVDQIGQYVGTIKSRQSTTVQPQAEGFITSILVTSGTRVSRGTALFEIDATAQQAVVSSLEAQRASREADVAYARQQEDRATTLLGVGAISQQEHEQALTLRKTAEAQFRSVEDQLRQQMAELAYYRVVAQTSGVVGDVPVRVGDRVTRSTVLTTVDGDAGLEAYINVPVHEAPNLRLGLPVRLVDDAGRAVAESQVSFIAVSVDEATQTVLVKAPVTVGASVLRADQYVRAEIVWSTDLQLMLPVVAVQRVNDQYFAFVAAAEVDGSLVARQRPVDLGPVTGNAYVVRRGLSVGDRLVLSGTQKIGDGVPVQVLPSIPADPDAAAGSGQGGR